MFFCQQPGADYPRDSAARWTTTYEPHWQMPRDEQAIKNNKRICLFVVSTKLAAAVSKGSWLAVLICSSCLDRT